MKAGAIKWPAIIAGVGKIEIVVGVHGNRRWRRGVGSRWYRRHKARARCGWLVVTPISTSSEGAGTCPGALA